MAKPNKKKSYVRGYHFTPPHFGIGDIVKRRLKIATYSNLNDDSELGWMQLRNGDILTDIYREFARERLGLLSFTSSYQTSRMWCRYAQQHEGVCLGFDICRSNQILEVRYVSALGDVAAPPGTSDAEVIKTAPKPTPKLVDQLNPFSIGLLSTKHIDWEYEQEFRLLLECRESESGLFFRDITSSGVYLREVILGAQCEVDLDVVVAALKGFRHDVTIFRAEIAPRNEGVIKVPIETVTRKS